MILRSGKGCNDAKDLERVLPVLDRCLYDGGDSGAGAFEAVANGDPTCLEPFQNPQMHLFSGQMTVIVRSSETPGDIVLTVTAKGLRKASVSLRAE